MNSPNSYLCSECGHTKMGHWLDGKGCNSPKIDEKCSCSGFKDSGHYQFEELDIAWREFRHRLVLRWIAEDRKPIACTNATRPAPSDIGEALAYNTDSCAFEVSDGTNWRDEQGLLT